MQEWKELHVPVLAREVDEWLSPGMTEGSTLIDCTVGYGGHSELLLSSNPTIHLVGVDRDEEALEATRERLSRFGNRMRLMKEDFRNLESVLEKADEPVKGILYDLGVSSPQLDRPDRGFQLRSELDLDMRMDRSDPKTAADVVNSYSEAELGRILFEYGEERYSRRIARRIVSRRSREPIQTGRDLAEVVIQAIPASARRKGPHPARRTFQALRIEVNGELGALTESLPKAIGGLAPGGRLAVISYHSLEDRIAKRTIAGAARGCRCPVDAPQCVCGAGAVIRVLTRKPIRPSVEEMAANPRSDSGRLRVAEKLQPPTSDAA